MKRGKELVSTGDKRKSNARDLFLIIRFLKQLIMEKFKTRWLCCDLRQLYQRFVRENE